MNPLLQIILGYTLAAICAIGALYGGYLAREGHIKFRDLKTQKSVEAKMDNSINQSVQGSYISTNQQAGRDIININPPVNITSDTREQRNKKIREALGKFLNEGHHIQVRCETNGQNTHKEFVDWCTRIKEYFKELDSSYQARFENIGKYQIQLPQGMSAENTHTWYHVETRKRNIEEFIKEYK
jgi:hypothetical protein